jgi:hypothetical protein
VSSKWLRYAGLLVSLVWACGWVLFEMVEAMESRDFGQAIFTVMVMLGAVAIAWRWTVIGGVLLILEGLGAMWLFAPVWIWRFSLMLVAMMPMPPMVAGVLLLLSKGGHVSRRTAHA